MDRQGRVDAGQGVAPGFPGPGPLAVKRTAAGRLEPECVRVLECPSARSVATAGASGARTRIDGQVGGLDGARGPERKTRREVLCEDLPAR